MADHSPHPLVTALAKKLGTPGSALEAAAKEFETAEAADLDKAKRKLANALARQPDLPELMSFAGFVGGVLDDKEGVTKTAWQLLYLDAKLRTWLLIKQDDILLRRRVGEDKSPFGKRDIVWLKADASLSEGSGPIQPDDLQARFLRGGFTRAADVAASLTDGAPSASTGVFCSPTPSCCGRPTRLTRSC